MDKMISKLDAAIQQMDAGNVGAARILVENVRNELLLVCDVVDAPRIDFILQRNFKRAER
jgi:hypothetical protein